MIKDILLIIIGFSGGLAVGSGFVAFLTVLGIIPRLTQLTKTHHFIRGYEWSVILGAVIGTWGGLRNTHLIMPALLLIPIGLASGIFVGMLAAALTEVLNVLPILSKRIGINEQILVLLMAIVLGKVFGSLFHWSFFVDK
ncbi:stage V sporulation protein AB [Scopulibacillus darangshiensis]|uniref:Stage V sporulation protein AB n=1 Tax=Scopulibacillus darangshiensis TaxID=442528 RepID=A0A4V2SNL9_9BACL|nr:stage V sporulation protein AB [Scopulibacillus darangshiensis]TCP31726.1 stage V sporulation protein AB [Scopulibacillus darangshiensis]